MQTQLKFKVEESDKQKLVKNVLWLYDHLTKDIKQDAVLNSLIDYNHILACSIAYAWLVLDNQARHQQLETDLKALEHHLKDVPKDFCAMVNKYHGWRNLQKSDESPFKYCFLPKEDDDTRTFYFGTASFIIRNNKEEVKQMFDRLERIVLNFHVICVYVMALLLLKDTEYHAIACNISGRCVDSYKQLNQGAHPKIFADPDVQVLFDEGLKIKLEEENRVPPQDGKPRTYCQDDSQLLKCHDPFIEEVANLTDVYKKVNKPSGSIEVRSF